MDNIRAFKVRDVVYYSVYNSAGKLALYTSNSTWARHIAREFLLNPTSTEVVVTEARSTVKNRL